MHRMTAGLTLAVIVLLAAAPLASAADTYHYRERGAYLNAYYSNWSEGPGTYFDTYVWASAGMSQDGGMTWEYDVVCADHSEYTIDESGNWIDGSYAGGCVEGAGLVIDGRKLSSASVEAAIPVFECVDAECNETVQVGTIAVDLDVAGFGPLSRYHQAGGSGVAGAFQSTYHGTGVERQGVVTGTVMFDGASWTAGADTQAGWLGVSRSGWIDVMVCNPRNPC